MEQCNASLPCNFNSDVQVSSFFNVMGAIENCLGFGRWPQPNKNHILTAAMFVSGGRSSIHRAVNELMINSALFVFNLA